MVHNFLAAVSFFLLSVVNTGGAADTQKQNKTIPSAGIRVISVQAVAGVEVNNNAQDGVISLDARLEKSGSVYGIHSTTSYPLEIITKKYGDSLVITTSPLSDMILFGISTLKETLDLKVSVPGDVKVVYVTGDKELKAEISKKTIAAVYCEGKRELEISGDTRMKVKTKEFEFYGAGTQYISLIAKEVAVTIK